MGGGGGGGVRVRGTLQQIQLNTLLGVNMAKWTIDYSLSTDHSL